MKSVNQTIQKKVQERIEKTPMNISVDDPDWSNIVEMCHDALKQQLYAFELVITQISKSFTSRHPL